MNSDINYLKQESLRAAGYSYLVGDAALFASGMMSGRKHEALSGAVYTAGGLVLARYGKENAERRLHTMQGRLKEYFDNEHIQIPKASELNSITLKSEGSIIDRIEDFMYAYPSQILNTMYAIGGFSLIHSGMKHGKGWDSASGALVAAGALAGILIPEKQHAPDHLSKTPLDKVVEWAQEKPLRVSGYLYMANNAALITSALKERKANPLQKSYMFKLLTVASYMVGNGLLAISSKDSVSYIDKDGNSKAMQQLETTAARVIAAQPEEIRNQVIQQTSGFLAGQPDIKLSATQIASDLTQRISELSRIQNKSWRTNVMQQKSNQISAVIQ